MKTEPVKRWIDPSYLYIEDDEKWDILEDVPAGEDGYPGYLIRGRRKMSDGKGIPGPRFTLGMEDGFGFEVILNIDINLISDDERLYDVAPFGSKGVVIPGYIVFDYSDNDDWDYKIVDGLRIGPTHAPLHWVETLFLPVEMSIRIEDTARVFPSLSEILFYTPGVIEAGYIRRDLEELTLDPEEIPEVYHHDYEYYVLGKNCPYKTERAEGEKFKLDDEDDDCYCMLISREEYEKGDYREEKDIYDVVYSNMVFRYDAARQTVALTHAASIPGGRLIVPESISFNGMTFPVSGLGERNIYEITDWGDLRFEEIELPRGCNILGFYNSDIRAIIFRN